MGVASHACPGAALATTIAAAGVEAFLAAGYALRPQSGDVAYRRSANARVPLLTLEAPA